jgi:cytoplasmic iron level regulating protein YaaA (DUF328/UPF0246 family)
MIAILSPAKRMEAKTASSINTQPQFLDEAMLIMKKLRTLKVSQLQKLMDISPKIADQNMKRNFDFSLEHTPDNSTQAFFAYKGDVYVGLEPFQFDRADLDFAQKHIRIISGLYGVLRPLDLIQEYRLEMGIKLKLGRKKDLYEFWKEPLTQILKSSMEESGSNILVNTASDEYFNVFDLKKLKAVVLKIQFREYKDEQLQFVSFNTKKARGAMARYIIKNKITEPESIKGFDYEGYYFDEQMSNDREFWFVR